MISKQAMKETMQETKKSTQIKTNEREIMACLFEGIMGL